MIRKLLQASVSAAIIAALAACSGQQSTDAAHAGDHADAAAETASQNASASHDGSTEHAAPVGGRVSGHGTHDYKPPDITEMSGSFQLTNAKTGGTFTEKDLKGSWTLLYMGYIECLEACPIAMKTMPQAVDKLNAMGISTKAVFIDINAPRLDDVSGGLGHGAKNPKAPGSDAAAHGSSHGAPAANTGAGDVPVNELKITGPEIRRQAIAEWGKAQDPDIVLLSGSRKQVLAAGTLFKSRAEQTMMPTQEVIHHINHTTYIYGINPQGDVVALLYHSDSPQMIVDEMVEASKAPPSRT
jgi:cytochrome oxidase Cu insertion factor (SCO1/SenC/PrrC family)